MSETMTRTAELIIVAGRSVGTICLWGPCVLCERPFAVQNGERVLAANDKDGRRVGAVCPDCAVCDEAALGQKLQTRAERLRRKADELERWISGGIRASLPERPAPPPRRPNRGVL